VAADTQERSVACLFLALLQARVGRSLVARLAPLGPEAILRAPPEELAAGEKALRELSRLRGVFDPEHILRRARERGLRVLTLADGGYPGRLREMPDPPPALFVSGGTPGGAPWEGPAVALVGSRGASPTGLETASTLGRSLAERGVCVVSGLALGVDAAAHEGALAGGGTTVGVLGCGIDVVYPRAHAELFGRVAAAGALLSEYFLGEAPLAWRFPARNRIIAGLSDAVVVVEAPEKSGALITARHALEAGRDVWAVPGPPGMRECRGSNRLLADGAGVLWDAAEFLDAVAPRTRERASQEPLPLPAGLPATEAAVLSGVGLEPAGVDLVAGRCGVAMEEVLPALALLELKGYVRRGHDGAYARRVSVR
jgi:DNA processing protein